MTATIAQSGFVLPHGYRLELGGESQKRNEAVGKLLGQVGIIVVLLITVLVMSFNSFTTTGLILINALQAAMLGLLSVFIAGYPFGFTVIIGLLGLMGLAINAAIVILSELNSLQALTDKNKIVAAVMTCSRHISSTTITTVGGFLPLILAGGGFCLRCRRYRRWYCINHCVVILLCSCGILFSIKTHATHKKTWN